MLYFRDDSVAYTAATGLVTAALDQGRSVSQNLLFKHYHLGCLFGSLGGFLLCLVLVFGSRLFLLFGSLGGFLLSCQPFLLRLCGSLCGSLCLQWGIMRDVTTVLYMCAPSVSPGPNQPKTKTKQNMLSNVPLLETKPGLAGLQMPGMQLLV